MMFGISCGDSAGQGGAGGSGFGIAQQAVTTCVTIQRGTNGTVSDASVTSNQGSYQMGSEVDLHTGKSGTTTQRTFFKFDLSSIPSGATITSANVTLNVSATYAMAMKAHKVTATWAETNPGGVLGSNQPAYVTNSTIGTLTKPASSWGLFSFSVLAQVQSWVAGTDPNYGMVLEDDVNTRSTGYSASETGTVANRPKLVVCYDSGTTSSSTASSTAASTAAATTTASSTADSTTTAASTSASSSDASSSASSSDASSSSSASSSSGAGGGGSVTTRIAVIGDFGALGTGLSSVSTMVNNWNPDFVLTTGDNVYDTAANPYDTNNGQFYHAFMYPYTGAYGSGSSTSTNRFFPIPGNHDWDKGTNYLGFYGPMLTGTTGPTLRRYYHHALDAGAKIHHYALDVGDDTNGVSHEPDGNSYTSTQGQWLQAAMAADTSSCFKIITEHEPPHCSTIGSSEGPEAVMDWPYASWGADLVMSGSRHGYERLSFAGIPYVVNGLGGGSLWGNWNIIDPYSVYRFPTTPQRYGAQLITITIGNGTGTLVSEFYGVSNTGVPDSSPSDTLTITKSCN